MAKLRIAGFDGVVPRVSPTMLADNQAQQADSVKLYAGELRTWDGPLQVFTASAPDLKTIYQVFRGPASLHDDIWLTWASDVDVAPGPVADTDEVRVYYTGDGKPKKTNWALATGGTGAYPRGWRYMGVPAPTSAPSVALTSGTNAATETRAYVYTYVSTFGSLQEESAPSPASGLITVAASQSVNVSSFAAPPTTGYNITAIRIYRTTTPGSEMAGYALVKEIPVGTSTTNDDLPATSLGELLSTIGWTPPPDNMVGLVAMPNGVLAGFVGNSVYFSEPYKPHAWPVRYSVSVPYTIVGLASYGNSLIVMTDYHPFAINGVSPGAMTTEKIPLPEPCVSKRSIAVDQFGVVYASPNGLVGISPETRALITTKLFRKEEWLLYQPEFMLGTIYNGKYIGFFESATQGKRAMVLSRDDIPALSFIDAYATACRTSTREAMLYYAKFDSSDIVKLDADPLNPTIYEWRSKRFVLPKATTFGAMKVDVDVRDIADTSLYIGQTEAAIAKNQTLFSQDLKGALNRDTVNQYVIGGSILTPLPTPASSKWVKVFIFADGNAVAVLTVTSFDPIRLPPFKGREFEIKLSGNTSVRAITLATTVPELHHE